MADMTADQLSDFRLDIGDPGSVFTDDEIQRLWARAGEALEDADDERQYALTMYYGCRQLLASAVKFVDYTVGQTTEKKEQVFKHLEKMRDYWGKEAQKARGSVVIVATHLTPPSNRDTPYA